MVSFYYAQFELGVEFATLAWRNPERCDGTLVAGTRDGIVRAFVYDRKKTWTRSWKTVLCSDPPMTRSVPVHVEFAPEKHNNDVHVFGFFDGRKYVTALHRNKSDTDDDARYILSKDDGKIVDRTVSMGRVV